MHQLISRNRAERYLAQRPKPRPARRPSRLATLLLVVLAGLLLTDAEKGEPARPPRPAHRRAETGFLLCLAALLLVLAALKHSLKH